MRSNAPFLSCDWGTSSFRLRLAEASGAVLKEARGGHGCKAIFEAAREQGRPAAALYEETLKRELQAFADAAEPGRKVDLAISGMASSTIGWRELPYLEEPLRLDGGNLRFAEVDWPGPDWLGRTFLISGVALHPEIMRGEETEAIGLLASRREFEGTLVLPGTHSKHLTVQGAAVRAIATHMTGELFDVMARHSILKASVSLEGAGPEESFDEGVRQAARHGLGRSLFRVRTRSVLDRADGASNAQFLSGVLIGAEISDLLNAPGRGPILLAGAPQFRDRYARALRILDPRARWDTPSAKELEEAAPRAHALFLAARREAPRP